MKENGMQRNIHLFSWHNAHSYKPKLKANGTVFDVQIYCHKQNSESIKVLIVM